MRQVRSTDWLFHLYLVLFLAYMLVPLIVMGGAAFNDSRFPSVYPWVGWTDRWFVELWADTRMWNAFANTIYVALAVVAISVPVGTAAAIVINSIAGTTRSVLSSCRMRTYFSSVSASRRPRGVEGTMHLVRAPHWRPSSRMRAPG